MKNVFVCTVHCKMYTIMYCVYSTVVCSNYSSRTVLLIERCHSCSSFLGEKSAQLMLRHWGTFTSITINILWFICTVLVTHLDDSPELFPSWTLRVDFRCVGVEWRDCWLRLSAPLKNGGHGSNRQKAGRQPGELSSRSKELRNLRGKGLIRKKRRNNYKSAN